MRKLAFLLILIIMLLLTVGWSNGPKKGNGFGTHDWIIKEAWDALGRPKWFNFKAARLKSDNPDTVLNDPKNHYYDRWGPKRYGKAPQKIDRLFNEAVESYRQKKYDKTSRIIGLMSHYFSDINNPLHTDRVKYRRRMHKNYETDVTKRTNVVDERYFIAKFNGKTYVSDVSVFAIKAASEAHKHYKPLFYNYNRYGFNTKVKKITKKRLNRAVNGLADLIFSVKKRARILDRDESVVIETVKGTMVIKLFRNAAPMTVDNFIKLTNQGFYNGLTFHRVVPGFVIQGGDPLGNGSGGPGYTIPAEFNSRPHLRGTVGMARAADPNSGGSQFYICLEPQPSLDGNYTVFGRVVEGLDVIDRITVGDVMTSVHR